MDTTAPLRQFAETAVFDTAVFGLARAAQSHVGSFALNVLRFLLFPVILVLAQVAPFFFKRHIDLILPHLPNITDRGALMFLRDALTVYYYGAQTWLPLTLFKKRTRALLEVLDEEIDSLKFALEHRVEIDITIEKIERQ